MSDKIYSPEINERITIDLRGRKGFIEEALGHHEDWDDADELALRFRNATWRQDVPGAMVFAFFCSMQLDPKTAPVTDWIAETVADASAALPEQFAMITEIELYCSRSHGFLEVL